MKIYSLQAFRGLAALAVVLIHSMASTLVFVSEVDQETVNLFNYGLLGVDFFFVLSGFIIFNSHYSDSEGNDSLKRYLMKRLIRIFPPYLPICLAYIAVFSFIPNISKNGHEWGWISSIFLIPTASDTALGPAWTLIYEMMFYAIFSLWFFGRSYFFRAMVVWFVLILTFQILFGYEWLQQQENIQGDVKALLTHITSALNLEFMAGMVCAYLFKSGNFSNYSISSLLLSIALITICFVYIPSEFNSLKSNGVFFGIAFAFLIFAIIEFEKKYSINIPSFMTLLGDASYAIYLVHYPIVSVVSRVVGLKLDMHSALLNVIVCTIISVIIGVVYHKKFEKPVIHYLSNKLIGRRLDAVAYSK